MLASLVITEREGGGAMAPRWRGGIVQMAGLAVETEPQFEVQYTPALSLYMHADRQGDRVGPVAANASDQELIVASLDGDGYSYAKLVERYEGSVAAILWHFTRDRLSLDELVQDTFVEAYFSLRRFRTDAPFYPWLRRIATRVGYRSWRRAQRDRWRENRLLQRQAEGASEVGAANSSETAEYVYRVLELLPPKDRLVLTLQYFEGCTTKEIAERMGWTTSLVKVRAFRARKKLRTLLVDAEYASHEDY